MKRPVLVALALLFALQGALAAMGRHHVRLAPAKTWVGVARVHLEVSELTVVDNALVGTYEIRVPLAPSRDDHGTVRFELGRPLEQTLVEGATLDGLGHSQVDRRTHRISCSFGDDESVQIVVRTGNRVLSFRSRWSPGA